MTDQFMVTPVRHDNGDYMNQVTNDYLFTIIKEGGLAVGKSPDMRAWKTLYDDSEIWSIVAYMRTLADPPYRGPFP